MTKVIDFGPVDWSKIWGDRASLVSAEHLKELNSITNATHLSHPGYWRNLFAAYPEVISRQGFIADHYTYPGQKVTTKTFQMDASPTPVGDMNRYVQATHEKTAVEVSFQRVGVPYDPLASGISDVVVDTKASVGKFIEQLPPLPDFEKWGTLLLGGVVLVAGSYVYGQVKR